MAKQCFVTKQFSLIKQPIFLTTYQICNNLVINPSFLWFKKDVFLISGAIVMTYGTSQSGSEVLFSYMIERKSAMFRYGSTRSVNYRGEHNKMRCISEYVITMGLLPDTWNCGLRMCRECLEHFPRHRLQRKPLGNDPSMHLGTSGSLTRGGGENVPGTPDTCATHNFTYLVRGPCLNIPNPWQLVYINNIHKWISH